MKSNLPGNPHESYPSESSQKFAEKPGMWRLMIWLIVSLCVWIPSVQAQTCDGVTVAGRNDQIYLPGSVFVDGAGYVYVAEQVNNRILKYPPNSTSASSATTVAGGNGAGSQANKLYFPSSVFVTASGYMYVADRFNHRIQKFPPNSTSATSGTTIAGGNGPGSTSTSLYNPRSVYVDGSSNLYVADFSNHRIQKFPPNSTSATSGTTVAGGNRAGSGANQLDQPGSVYVDGTGTIYVADYNNNRIQKFPPTSTSATAGITTAGGNGQGAGRSQLNSPSSIFLDGSGNRYIADVGNHRIQMFPPNSTSATSGTTIAGGNGAGSGANQLNAARNAVVDGTGNLYVADTDNHRIQKFPAGSNNASNATTIAGSSGPEVTATQLYFPADVFVDGAGYRYVADTQNHRIQKFPPNSTLATSATTIAGGQGAGSAANRLSYPQRVAVDGAGNLYVADTENHRIQKFPPNSTSVTAGITVAGGNGDGSSAYQFRYPEGVAVDAAGNLYVADQFNDRIQKFPPNSTSVTAGITVAGGNGGGLEANRFNNPMDIFVDGAGNLYVADMQNHRIQKFPPNSTPVTAGTTVAGGNGAGSADNQLNHPMGVSVDEAGYIYVSSSGNARVQRFPPNSTSATAGVIVAGGNGEGIAANQLYEPFGIFLDRSGNLFVADQTNNRIQQFALTVITQQPASSSIVSVGSNISTFISTTGSTGTYQWYKDGSPVSGQTSATLSLTNVQLSDAGTYAVLITTACTSLTSTPFSLSVILPIRYVRANATGDGSSWATASGDLQAMINAPSVQQVWMQAGIYKPTATTDRTASFSIASGVQVYGGFAGTETSLDQRKLGAPLSTTLSGDIGTLGITADNSYHVVRFENASASTRLDGFILTGGNADLMDDDADFNRGGGIYNHANGLGQSSTPLLVNLQLLGNRASYGGGLCNFADNDGNSSPTLINVSLMENVASFGGAVFNSGSTAPRLVNVSLSNNTASVSGGAIYGYGFSGGSTTSLVNGVVYGNGGNKTFAGISASVQVSYSLLESSVTGYGNGNGNLTTTTSPFASTTSVQLAANSDAIDAGSNQAYSEVNGPSTDLAGNPRFIGYSIDMGALELAMSDLSLILFARPSSVQGAKPFTVVVDVYELNSVATTGGFSVKISKDPKVSLSFDATATTIGGKPVQNSAWGFSGPVGGYYTLTTNQPMAAGDLRSVGLSGTLTPGATTGVVTVSSTVIASGFTEAAYDNNTDADKVDYFQQ